VHHALRRTGASSTASLTAAGGNGIALSGCWGTTKAWLFRVGLRLAGHCIGVGLDTGIEQGSAANDEYEEGCHAEQGAADKPAGRTELSFGPDGGGE
jgi:hypothetical protein